MKLCKDCAHYRELPFDKKLSMCALSINVVDGSPDKFCALSREFGPCGEDAAFYQEKKRVSWFVWLKKIGTKVKNT